jgi:nucleoside-diphosphate-sugar epimerase
MAQTAHDKIAILGATGPSGICLSQIFQKKSCRVRVVSRNSRNLERLFPDDSVERLAVDLTDPDGTRKAVSGMDLVFDCVGLPADQMGKHHLIARNIGSAVQESGADCVQISSFWSYLPIRSLPVDENHPREGGPDWSRYRREAEDVLLEAGASVLHLPDFYGPHVHTSILQNALQEAVQGKPVNWIGSSQTNREHIFIQDAMEIAAKVSKNPSAKGQKFIVPGTGPLNGDRLISIIRQHLGEPVKLRSAGPFLLRIASLFQRELRLFMPMIPHYIKPITFDASALRRLIGPIKLTSYEEGIGETLDWIQNSRR